MDRSTKEACVGELREIFTGASAALLVDYRGLGANALVTLRKDLDKVSARMKIIKNTLARLAAEGTPFSPLVEHFSDTRALVYSATDPVGQAKVLKAFTKTHQNTKVKIGLLCHKGQSTLLDEAAINELALLPSRDELIAKLLFVMNAPVTQFARTLNEVPASFVRVLAAIAESKQS